MKITNLYAKLALYLVIVDILIIAVSLLLGTKVLYNTQIGFISTATSDEMIDEAIKACDETLESIVRG